MNKEQFVGKMCPYCKTTISSNDDIVICSICNMPHHKECWVENQGCTTFGCTGTIMSPDGGHESGDAAPQDSSFNAPLVNSAQTTAPNQLQNAPVPLFCSKCGARRKESSLYCRICGVKFNK